MDLGDQRQWMVEDQLVHRGIQDPRVLAVMGRIPRHRFIPKALRGQSYSDHPVSIGQGQTISQPYMVALMTQELRLFPDSKVLDIGTGSGYQTAILAELAKEVYSIERIASLAYRAEATLKRLGYRNVQIRIGDGSLGWPEAAPFDRILVTASCPIVPSPLLDQLNTGGLLVLPLGSAMEQTLTVFEKIDDKIQTRQVCGCVFVPLIGAHGWKEVQENPSPPGVNR